MLVPPPPPQTQIYDSTFWVGLIENSLLLEKKIKILTVYGVNHIECNILNDKKIIALHEEVYYDENAKHLLRVYIFKTKYKYII